MGTYIVSEDVSMAHITSNDHQVIYDHDEIAEARAAAYVTYGPRLEPLGGWHTHPWKVMSVEAIMPQMSDDDADMMQVGDIELIIASFPSPDYKVPTNEYSICRRVGTRCTKGEVYLKVAEKQVVPCTLVVR